MSEQRDVVEETLAELSRLGGEFMANSIAADRHYKLIRRLRSMLEGAVEGWAEKDEWWTERGLETWEFHVGDVTDEARADHRMHPALLILLPRDTEAE